MNLWFNFWSFFLESWEAFGRASIQTSMWVEGYTEQEIEQATNEQDPPQS